MSWSMGSGVEVVGHGCGWLVWVNVVGKSFFMK